MAFDPEPRILDLLDFLQAEYKVTDRQAVELMLSCSLPLDGVPTPYLIIETDWLSQEMKPAWFGFAGLIRPNSLSKLRAGLWPRYIPDVLAEWRDAAKPGPLVMVEPDWRMNRPWHTKLNYYVAQVFSKALRIRTTTPRTLGCLERGPGPEARYARLYQLSRAATISEIRTRTTATYTLPKDYAFWAELTMLSCRLYTSWEFVAQGLVEVAQRRAALYNRAETNKEDWQLAGRVASDLIPASTADILRASLDRVKPEQLKDGKREKWFGECASLLTERHLRSEIKRLQNQAHLLEWVRGSQGIYRVPERIVKHVGCLLDGKAFG